MWRRVTLPQNERKPISPPLGLVCQQPILIGVKQANTMVNVRDSCIPPMM